MPGPGALARSCKWTTRSRPTTGQARHAFRTRGAVGRVDARRGSPPGEPPPGFLPLPVLVPVGGHQCEQGVIAVARGADVASELLSLSGRRINRVAEGLVNSRWHDIARHSISISHRCDNGHLPSPVICAELDQLSAEQIAHFFQNAENAPPAPRYSRNIASLTTPKARRQSSTPAPDPTSRLSRTRAFLASRAPALMGPRASTSISDPAKR